MTFTDKLLQVPEHVSKIIFPNERLSVFNFLQYPFPAITSVVSNPSVQDFFDTVAPLEPVDLAKLVKQPLPSPHTVKQLIEALPEQSLAGNLSITCVHGGMFSLKRLPFWVLGYWDKVLQYRKILFEWLKADDWVRRLPSRLQNDEDRQVVKKVLDMFTLLPWSGALCGTESAMTIQALPTFLGSNWLATDHMDLLLDTTRRRLSRTLDVLQEYQLRDLAFINKLISAYQTEGEIPAHIHKVAADLMSGRCHGIGGYANVNKDHWIAWAVSPDWILYYGDGINNQIDKTVEAALTWWLQPYARQEISVKRMKITPQLDGHSCGILSDNALEHFFSSDVPLISHGRIPILRCKAFLDICERHLAMCLNHDEANSDDTHVFPFTFTCSFTKDEEEGSSPGELESPIVNLQTSKRKVIGSPIQATTSGPIKKKTRSSVVESPLHDCTDSDSNSAADELSNTPTNMTSTITANKLSGDGRQGTLLNYLIKFDQRKDYENHLRESMIKYKEEKGNWQETLQERKEHLQEVRRKRIQEGNAERQRKTRQRKHEEKETSGKRMDSLRLHDKKSHLQRSVAEMSRPYREFREELRRKNTARRQIYSKVAPLRTNWFTPFLWQHILWAGDKSKPEMRPSDIIRILKLKWPLLFGKLTQQVLGRWIDRTGTPRWSDKILKLTESGNRPQAHSKRVGILKPYPDVVARIVTHLKSLRDGGAPLSLLAIRGIMIAHFECYAPEIFDTKFENGKPFDFLCRERFVQRFLHNELRWSERRATGNARKLLPNWEEKCYEAVLRVGWVLKNEDIPAELFVNSDQTGVTFSQGSDVTWAPTGSTQVIVAGHDEKRAFTLVVSVSSSGIFLPLQAVYRGKSSASCPSQSSEQLKAAQATGCKFTYSGKDNHWSSHKTMHEFVDEILAPYFDARKKELGRPVQQKSIWLIDCWVVHRSKEFLEWMKEHHPNIIILFVPANCTGVLQPCDVGIQRPLKLCIKRLSHEDIVREISEGLTDEDVKPHEVKITKSLPALRDRSVRWIYSVYQALNKPELIKKSFEMCRAKGFNLSYECLSGYQFRQLLRDLPETNPAFHHELLTSKRSCGLAEEISEDIQIQEDDQDLSSDFDDESSLSLDVVFAKTVGQTIANAEDVVQDKDGNFVSQLGEVEASVEQPSVEPPIEDSELGRGRRVRKPSTRFADGRFWEEH